METKEPKLKKFVEKYNKRNEKIQKKIKRRDIFIEFEDETNNGNTTRD